MWTDQAAHVRHNINAQDLVGNPERTRLHRRPRSRRVIILKWVVKKEDWTVVWVRLVQDSVGGLPSCDRNVKSFFFLKMRETV